MKETVSLRELLSNSQSPAMRKAAEKLNKLQANTTNFKKGLILNESSFEMLQTGSITTIKYADGKDKKMGSFFPHPGMHIPRLVNKNVKSRIESGEYVPKNQNPNRWNSNTIMYSSDAIKKNLSELCVSVDVIGCYWQTAFNLGIIDQRMYDIGIAKDREYKDARNIAIGSIGSLMIYEKYENGKLITRELRRKFGACARLDIVDHVWEMAQRIAKHLGPDFLMFLTDCFFVPANREADVISLLEIEGYKSKAERLCFYEVQRMRTEKVNDPAGFYTEKVIWFKLDKDQWKFHDFSNKHNFNFSLKTSDNETPKVN